LSLREEAVLVALEGKSPLEEVLRVTHSGEDDQVEHTTTGQEKHVA